MFRDTIYGLKDRDGRIIYVGKTARALNERMQRHRAAAKVSHLPLYRFLRESGCPVDYVVLEAMKDTDVGGSNGREKYWIDRMLEAGQPLLNTIFVRGNPLASRIPAAPARIGG